MNEALKKYRKANALGQAAMAEILGISKSLVSMVETGTRELPAEATRIFVSLQHSGGGDTAPAGKNKNPLSGFTGLQNSHKISSGEYLETYRRDCLSELYKYEKQVKKWKKQYNLAVSDLIFAASELKLVKNDSRKEKKLLDISARFLKAELTVQEIAFKQPELMMIKIAGLKQQLRTLKAMMGKNKLHLGMSQQHTEALLKITGMDALQLDPPSKILSASDEK